MRTTIVIDQQLLELARQLTNIEEKTSLVRAGLEALIAWESAKRLASLAGSDPELPDVPRRQMEAVR